MRLGAAGVGVALLTLAAWLESTRQHPLFLWAALYAGWITALPWVWTPCPPCDE